MVFRLINDCLSGLQDMMRQTAKLLIGDVDHNDHEDRRLCQLCDAEADMVYGSNDYCEDHYEQRLREGWE